MNNQPIFITITFVIIIYIILSVCCFLSMSYIFFNSEKNKATISEAFTQEDQDQDQEQEQEIKPKRRIKTNAIPLVGTIATILGSPQVKYQSESRPSVISSILPVRTNVASPEKVRHPRITPQNKMQNKIQNQNPNQNHNPIEIKHKPKFGSSKIKHHATEAQIDRWSIVQQVNELPYDYENPILPRDKDISRTYGTENDAIKYLTIMASQSNTVVTFKNGNLTPDLKSGLYLIVINNDKMIKLLAHYDTRYNRDEMLNFINKLDTIDPSDTIVIVSGRSAFTNLQDVRDPLYSKFTDALKKINTRSKINKFNPQSNYIFIGNKNNSNIYYERLSNDPAYFPFIEIIKKECRFSSRNDYPPEKYLQFREKTYDINAIMKCSQQANMKGMTKFSLTENTCIPMSDKQWEIDFKNMPSSAECLDDYGTDKSIMGYAVNKIISESDLPNHSVTVYYDGDQRNYMEGYFPNINKKIKLIKVPFNYYVFLIHGISIKQLIGPTIVDFSESKYINTLIVQKDNINNCKLYDDDRNLVLTYSPGRHILYPDLFSRITRVDLGKRIKLLNLYADVAFSDLIQDVNLKRDGQISKIKFTRVIRSIVLVQNN